MRIAHLTPGTGSFYCGTCLRDRALLDALSARGHEVRIVPMYLPSFPARGDAPIRMGAVNLYMQQKLAFWSRVPRWLRALLDAPWALRWAARQSGSTDPAFLGEMTVSMLQGAEGRLASAAEELVACFDEQPAPDVILLSNALLAGLVPLLREHTQAALVCTLQGELPFLDALPEPQRELAWSTLRERLQQIDAFVAVSGHYAELMSARLDLNPECVAVVLNGVEIEEQDPAAPKRPTLGFLSRMCADKGLPLLVEAFVILRERGKVPDLALCVFGVEMPEDRPLVEEQRRRLRAAGLEDDAEFLPNVGDAEKRALLSTLSVFSVPATDGESFGLYLLEAMAAGVPVVQPRHAAFPEIIEATGGGLLCEPNDPVALAETIERLLLDEEEARRLGERGRRAVREDFGADRMAREVEVILERALASRRETHV